MGNLLTSEDQHIACCMERQKPPSTEAEEEVALTDSVLLNLETDALTRGYIQ